MQIEVNQENIIKFNLVQMTGNSVEVLLQRAEEARQSGYVLAVQIPDDLIHMNVFDAAGSQAVDEEELRAQDQMVNPIVGDSPQPAYGRVVEVHVEGPVDDPSGEIVEGEIVESHFDD